MNLIYVTVADEFCHILTANSAAGENGDALAGLFDDFCQCVSSLRGIGLLAGGENAMETTVNDLFQRYLPVLAAVEGTVKGHLHGAGMLHGSAAFLHIYTQIGLEKANYHTGNAMFAAKCDVRQYRVELFLRIAKIAATGTNQHKGLQRQMLLTVQNIIV